MAETVPGRVSGARWSSELALPCPLVMFITKISGLGLSVTKTALVCIARFGEALHNLCNLFGAIRRRFFSGTPFIGMFSLHMLRMGIIQFKVFDSVVGFDSVHVMDSFSLSKFPSKVLLHYIAMLKHALSVYKNPVIAQRREAWRTFFEMAPVWGNLKIAIPIQAGSVHSTIATIIFGADSLTSVSVAFLSFCHTYLLAVMYYG